METTETLGLTHFLAQSDTVGKAIFAVLVAMEALIMTGAGLGVAIPAVLAYNAFARSKRLLLAKLDAFAHDLFAFLTTGAHGVGTEPDARSGAVGQAIAGGA
jgi:biopolymer transport protein ExbB